MLVFCPLCWLCDKVIWARAHVVECVRLCVRVSVRGGSFDDTLWVALVIWTFNVVHDTTTNLIFTVRIRRKRLIMSGRIINDKKKCKVLLKDLMDSVKECQNLYGKNKTLLATEKDVRYAFSSGCMSKRWRECMTNCVVLLFAGRINQLCELWEICLSHGLKTNSVFKNIVSGSLTETTSFWDFASQHLTGHEKERFSSLRYGNISLSLFLSLSLLLHKYILTYSFSPNWSW